MQLYELITPHDPYTYYAENDEQAMVVCVMLGGGHYGAKREGNEHVCAIMFGPGSSQWVKETYGEDYQTLFHKAITQPSLVEALNSVAVCDVADRQYLEKIGIDKWHDEHRSSLTDLREKAKSYAQQINQIQIDKELTNLNKEEQYENPLS